MAKPPKPTPAPALPDLRKAKPRTNAKGLVLLAYDPEKQAIVPVTLDAVLGGKPPPDTPNLADDLPLAEDDGTQLSTGDGKILVGDIR